MTNKTWNKYVDSGEIPHFILIQIAIKLTQHKQLTKQELSIYTTHSNEIEQLLKSSQQ